MDPVTPRSPACGGIGLARLVGQAKEQEALPAAGVVAGSVPGPPPLDRVRVVDAFASIDDLVTTCCTRVVVIAEAGGAR
jgi:hypothetical protein